MNPALSGASTEACHRATSAASAKLVPPRGGRRGTRILTGNNEIFVIFYFFIRVYQWFGFRVAGLVHADISRANHTEAIPRIISLYSRTSCSDHLRMANPACRRT